MPLDPQARAILDQMAEMNVPAFSSLEPAVLRAMRDGMAVPRPARPARVVTDTTVPGRAGAIPVRVYSNPGDSGTMVFYHGGGFLMGSIATHDEICHELAAEAGCSVVSVEYRLAPEHPFPAAPEDAYAATDWIAGHGAELGIDTGRLAVGGDSAGGTLGAVVPLMARDRGGPRIDFQLLIYPALDMDFSYPSFTENGEGYALTTADAQYFTRYYAPDAASHADFRCSPMRAASHAGLPPALIQTAGYDPLRDQGPAYAAKLRAAEVAVTYTCYEGMIHGFYGMGAAWTERTRALAEAGRALKNALARVPASA